MLLLNAWRRDLVPAVVALLNYALARDMHDDYSPGYHMVVRSVLS